MDKNRAIIYSMGKTHQLYINISDEEAERRFQAWRSERNPYEVAFENAQGIKVERGVVEFDDEILIWGDMGGEINALTQMMLRDIKG